MQIIERDRLLFLGAPGSGKSQAIVDVATLLPDVKVYAFDMQDSILPLLRAVGEAPPNLVLYRIGGEPVEAWDEFQARCKEVRATVKPGDWVAFDVAADWWQLVQDAYIEKVYEAASCDFKEAKLMEAVEQGAKTKKAPKKALGFGGLEPDEWSVVKGKYYITIPQTLSTRCTANIIVTANEKTPAHWMRGDEMVFREANLPGQYKKNLVKPWGEANLTSQVDVVLWLKHPTDKKWTLSTLGKNRFKVDFDDVDITSRTVWEVYCERLKRDPYRSPGFLDAPLPKKEKRAR